MPNLPNGGPTKKDKVNRGWKRRALVTKGNRVTLLELQPLSDMETCGDDLGLSTPFTINTLSAWSSTGLHACAQL